MASKANRLVSTHANQSISSQTIHIAGILTTVYGLSELSPQTTSLSCLWLHHARLQSKESMQDVAVNCIEDWNRTSGTDRTIGLIAVSFDQRNHGTRWIHPSANDTWKEGNETHAQDMFSIIQGTVLDTSLLIDHLESYLFEGSGSPTIHEHLVLGISLGGHSTWQLFFSDPRVTTAVAVIGCPDYLELISKRAKRLDRPSYTTTSGTTFPGSKDYPTSLTHAVNRFDPKGLLFGTNPCTTPSSADQDRLRTILDSRIKNKNILVQSGGADKLVPYACSKPFLDFLKGATAEGGWYSDGGVRVDDRVYEGVGHKFTEEMMVDAVRFVNETVGRSSRGSGYVWEKQSS